MDSIVQGWQSWTWEGGDGPGERQGHTMNLYGSQVIIFGGRTNDTSVEHIPKTYEIQEIDGKLEFTTYDAKEGKL